MILSAIGRYVSRLVSSRIWLSSHFGAYPATLSLPRFCEGCSTALRGLASASVL
jgi:hypothetical protein